MTAALSTKTPPKSRPALHRPPAQEAPADPPALARLLKGCSDECAELIRQGVRCHTNSVSGTLERMWELGRVVDQLREERHSKPRDGSLKPVFAVGLLAEASGMSVSALNKRGQLYRAFPSPERLAWLVSLRNRNGQALSFDHVEQLLPAFSDSGPNAEFDRLLRLTLAENLTPVQLAQRRAAVRDAAGGRPRAGGRPTPVPPTLTARLGRLIEHTSVIVKNDGEIYSHPEHNFAACARGMAQSAVAADADVLRAQVATARANMAALQEMFARKEAEFAELEAYFTQCELAMAHKTGQEVAAALDAPHAGAGR